MRSPKPLSSNSRCARCSCEFAKGKMLGDKMTWALFATANVLCLPDLAYVYLASPSLFHLHQKRCQLGPGACEGEGNDKYYVDVDQPWSQELAKFFSMYSGAYIGACLGFEEDNCHPLLSALSKILRFLGAELCVMAVLRYYWLMGQLLGAVDVQIFSFYTARRPRAVERGISDQRHQIRSSGPGDQAQLSGSVAE